MTSDMVVHKDERGIELRRSAFIGNDLDAEPAIPVLVFINDRLFGAGRGDCSKHLPNGHGLEPRSSIPRRLASKHCDHGAGDTRQKYP